MSWSRRSVLTLAPALALPASTKGRPGFFRVEKFGDKWSAVTPAGKPIYLRGLNHFGDGSHMPLNLAARHGSREAWRKSIRERHREWGFNYIPPSVGPSELGDSIVAPVVTDLGGMRFPKDIRETKEWPAADFAALDFPFAAFLTVSKNYMSGPGLPDVFSPEFRNAVDKKCREFVEPLANNPNLAGYHFSHNPPWHESNPSFTRWIADIVKPPSSPARKQWTALMHRIYGTPERWRATYGIPIRSFAEIDTLPFPLRGYVSKEKEIRDQIAFMRVVCGEYYRVYSETIRRYDKNHLIFGDRNTIHLSPLATQAIHTMMRYIDVLSINVMGPAETIHEVMEQVTPHYDGPVLLADTGAGIYNGSYPKAAYMCRDLAEFDKLVEGYMRAGLSHPQLIGFGWCGYYETPSARSGLVDSRTDETAGQTAAVLAKWNRWMDENFAVEVERRKQEGSK